MLLGLAVVLSWALPGSIPADSRPAGSPVRLSVIAYNVLYTSPDPDRSVDLLAQEDADLICLRELTPAFVKRFEARLGERYPHRVMKPKRGTWGVGIASKHPIVRHQHFPQKPHRLPALEARIKTDTGALTLVCVHLMPPIAKHRKKDGLLTTMGKNEALREAQARYLIGRYVDLKQPLLIAGDFNEGESDRAIKVLRDAGFALACDGELADCGATWPGATTIAPAVFRIDHILGRGVQFSSAQVIKGGGSDHYPVRSLFTTN